MAGDEELVEIKIRLKDARKFITDAKGVSRHVKDIGTQSKTTGKNFRFANAAARGFHVGIGAVTKAAKYGTVALAALAIGGVGFAVHAFASSEAVLADQAAALKSTGAHAWITGKQLETMASIQSMRTGTDHEAISTAQTLMLTFTKVRNSVGKNNDVFNQANLIVGDLAVRFKRDLPHSAIIVGKALQDPIKGVAALGRVGVQYSESQKKAIKTMIAHGNLLGAQKIVMKELRIQTHGAADAYGKTLAGSLSRGKVIVHDLGVAFGGLLAPGIKKAVDWASRFGVIVQTAMGKGAKPMSAITTALGRMLGWHSKTFKAWMKLRALIPKVAAFLHKMFTIVMQIVKKGAAFIKWVTGASTGAKVFKTIVIGLTAAFVAAMVISKVMKAWAVAQLMLNAAMEANPIGILIVAIVGIAAAALYAYHHFSKFRHIVDAVGNAIVSAFHGAVKFIRNAITTVIGFISKHWRAILVILTGPFGAVVVFIHDHFGQIVDFLKNMPGRIASAASGMWDGIKDAFKDAINWVITKWNNLEIGMDAVKVGGHTVVPEFHVGTPDIPLFAGGGVLHGTGIVGEHRPERVTELPGGGVRVDPLPTRLANRVRALAPDPFAGLATAGAGGGGGSSDDGNEFHLYIDGNEVNVKLARVVKRKKARK